MKIKLANLFLLLLMFSSLVLFSQTEREPNKEELFQFNNIVRNSENSFTAYIEWPQIISQNDSLFIYDLLVVNVNEENFDTYQTIQELHSYKFFTKANKRYLHLETSFSPNNTKMLASLFYNLGVSKVLVNQELTSIYQFSNAYKSYIHKLVRKTRTYLKD